MGILGEIQDLLSYSSPVVNITSVYYSCMLLYFILTSLKKTVKYIMCCGWEINILSVLRRNTNLTSAIHKHLIPNG